MRVVEFHLDVGYIGCEQSEIFEFDDDMTDDEIDSELDQWASDLFDSMEKWWGIYEEQ